MLHKREITFDRKDYSRTFHFGRARREMCPVRKSETGMMGVHAGL